MKKVFYILLIITVSFLCFAPVMAQAAGDGGHGGGSSQTTVTTFDFTTLYQPVKVADLSSWTNIFWNAIVWIAFGSPLANTFIGKSLSIVVLGGDGVQSFVTLFSSLGVFGAFIVIAIVLNHFRRLTE